MIDAARLYVENKRDGISYSELARRYGLTRGQVAGAINRHKQKRQNDANDKIVYINKRAYETDPLPSLDSLNDRARWQSTLTEVLNSKRFITVMHRCDVHNPFGDPAALALWDEMAEVLQPDIVVRGSDEDDLPTISVFVERGADVPQMEIDDFLDQMYINRANDTKRIKAVAPSAIQVNIEGNHGGDRFKKWVNKNARQSKTTLHRRYIENIRCSGDVMWIGFKESVVIQSLIVAHGEKYGDTAPKGNAIQRRFGWSIMAGHSHKPGMFSAVGQHPITSIVSGCLCQIPADYNDKQDDNYCEWQHGTVYATIDTKTGAVDIKEVRMNHSDNLMWFELGGRIYAHEVDSIALEKVA